MVVLLVAGAGTEPAGAGVEGVAMEVGMVEDDGMMAVDALTNGVVALDGGSVVEFKLCRDDVGFKTWLVGETVVKDTTGTIKTKHKTYTCTVLRACEVLGSKHIRTSVWGSFVNSTRQLMKRRVTPGCTCLVPDV